MIFRICMIFCVFVHAYALASFQTERTVALPVFGSYAPRTMDRSVGLPSNIQASISAIFKMFPKAFSERLNIERWCYVEEPSLPSTFNTRIRYSVVIRVTINHEVIKGSEFRMDFDESGILLSDLETPRFDLDGNIVLCGWSEIVEAFRENGVKDISGGSLILTYENSAMTLAWVAPRIKRNFFGREVGETVVISAADGRLLGKSRRLFP